MRTSHLVLFVASFAAATLSARTIGSVAAVTSGGATTGYTVSFGTAGENETNVLYLVWGTADAGTGETTDWEHATCLGTIPPETTQYAYTLTSDVKGPFLRFLLAPVQPYDTAVEYLESTADNTYVQTAFYPTGNSVVEADVTLTTAASGSNGGIFCARSGGSNLAAQTFTLLRIGVTPRFDYNATGGTGGPELAANTPYTFRTDYTGISVNGAKYTTGYGTLKSFTAGGPMVLFATYSETTHAPNANWQRMRLATFKAWSDTTATTLAMDLVPCKKNGSPALYDKVSKTFLTLTGSFAVGPETGTLVGETSLSALQVVPRRIIIAQGGVITGTVSPAYGTAVPATDAALACTASPVVDARHVAVSCTGYTLETWNGTAWSAPVAHDGETSYTYPADGTDVKRLTWQWARTVESGWEANVELMGDAGAALVVDNAEKAWFKDWLSAKGLTAALACTYDEIRYAGAGEITNVSEIAAYTGVVRVKEGAQVVAAAGNAFGAAASVTLHVEKGGCVRIWSAVANGTKLRVKTAYLAGTGRDGKGALYSTCPGNSTGLIWPLNIVLADDARIGWQNGNQDVNGVTFDLNGHDLNFLSRNDSYDRVGSGSAFNDSSVANNGRVIVDYSMLFEGTLTFCATGSHELVFRTNGVYRTNGAQGYANGGDWTNHWKLVMAGPDTTSTLGFHCGISRNGWQAPIEIRAKTRLTRQNNYASQTHFGPVSGDYGYGDLTRASMCWLRLANPNNTFKGGVYVKDDSYLSPWVNGAIPAFADSGAVTLENGCTVWLKDGIDYQLPDLKLTGTGTSYKGLMHGLASGAWRTVVKDDSTDMNWRSSVGAGVLDIRKGVFRIPSPLAGLYEGFSSADNALSDRKTATNTVQMLPLAMKFEGNVCYRADRGTTGYYTGYLWNRGTTDVTWGFAVSYNTTKYRLYIDDTAVLAPNSTTSPTFATYTLTPGAHRFEMRYTGQTTQGTKVNNLYPWSDQYKGWGIDTQGRGRTNTADYVVLADTGIGLVYTLAKTVDELPAACRQTMPVFETLVMTNLTSSPVAKFDLCGNSLTVPNVVGAPQVVNQSPDLSAGTFTVSDSWTVATKSSTVGGKTVQVPVGTASIVGTLAFAEDVTVEVPDTLAHGTYPLATATEPIVGTPTSGNEKWYLEFSADRKTLNLVWGVGLRVLIR